MSLRDKAASVAPRETFGVKVLVVDDNSSHRQLAHTLLRALGCEVWLAEDGNEALRLCRAAAFDVVLMDRHMPECDGDDAAWAIRRSGGPSSGAMIIAHTSDPPRGGAAAVYDRIIEKPIRISDMLDLATYSLRSGGRVLAMRHG
jgi:CheY-like chemotaxis protein